MKNLITFIALVFLFNPSSLFAEATDTLEACRVAAVTEEQCEACGCVVVGASCECGYSGGSYTADGADPNEGGTAAATGDNSYSGGPSSGTNTAGGGGGGNGTTGAAPITDEQANAYEASMNRECLNAVEGDDQSWSGPMAGLGRYEMDSDDIEACADYASCMRDAYINYTYMGVSDITTCANTTLCEAEYDYYTVVTTNVPTVTSSSFSASFIESVKFVFGSGVYVTEARATESYCNCMTHFGVQKTTSVCSH